jgi:DNA topoisomerase-2
LGTSTSAEFKEYFANKKIVDFVYSGQASDDSVDKVFNKKRADDRKTWLEQYNKHAFLNTSRPSVPYEDFIDQEMIHFSTYDCARSIPTMVDGLKISLRKILFSAFKRRLTSEIKVAQFSGYVSEHSAYHHGEASLNGAIVAMAQTFVGSNNVNLLEPLGQFGTRLQGGDDSASERYIFTHLNPLTRSIFVEADDHVLTYLNDDGTMVEPEFYCPIIPFALLNGISGIGTGFSANIPAFSPKQIIAYLQNKLLATEANNASITFVPYYEGFKGTVVPLVGDAHRFLVRGRYEKVSTDTIRITELPVGTWTMPYTTFLEGLMDGGVDKAGKKIAPAIKDFTSTCTEVAVDFTVTFPKGRVAELEATVDATTGLNGLEKLLKLSTTISTSNMHMFDGDCKLHKYGSVGEVIDAFYGVRMDMYAKRKAFLVEDLRKRLVKLSNRARYILATLDGTVDLRRKSGQVVHDLLVAGGYDLIDGDFKYLIKMPMDSVTEENVAHILKEKDTAEADLAKLIGTSLESMWLSELRVLEREYDAYRTKREQVQAGGNGGSGSGKKTIVKVKKAAVSKK